MTSRFPTLLSAVVLAAAAAVGCSPPATAQDGKASAVVVPPLQDSMEVPDEEDIPEDLSVATLAAGCFWCVEEPFAQLEGVYAVISGYAGGTEETANYKMVCSGLTRHAEAVQIFYDSEVISYDDLLEFFWHIHDPTQLNRQGPDTGPQYRSSVFYHDEEQKEAAEASRKAFDESDEYEEPVVTLMEEFTTFFPAEDYHQNFYRLNPDHRYVRGILVPKLRKLGLTIIE